MRKVLFLLALTTFCIAVHLSVVRAQALPSCASQASDPDGDGFGFENQMSCQIDDNSAGPPTIVNPVTGQPVIFERGYWNANRDIARRQLGCIYEVYNQQSRQFEGQSFHARAFTNIEVFQHQYAHDPIPLTAPFIGNMFIEGDEAGDIGESTLAWTVDNGV